MKFGTSGLRGLVTDLQGHASALYATAFAQHLLAAGHAKTGDRIFVAGDYRPSSPDIAATCIGALQRAGLTAVDCGSLPTPALALYAMTQGCASLMVTGSHIPADRNGIKFYRPDGEIDKADELEITHIAAEISDSIFDLTPGSARSEEKEALALFAARNSRLLPADALSGLKIGVYQHSTVARDGLIDVITGYGATTVALGRSDHFIPVDTEAVSAQTIELLRGWAKEHHLDAIVSADGDGDRPLVADETGTPLRGDLLGLIVARFLDAEVVVTPVTSNSGIEAAGGFRVTRTKVGSPFVIDGMNAASAAGETAVMGFEANGGVLTQSDFAVAGTTLTALPTRDSFLPVLATLLLTRREGKPLSSIAADFNLPVAAADRLENFAVETSAALMAHLRESPENLAAFLAPLGDVGSISDIDGLRVTLLDHSIVHLRPSGNAPEMRCYVEAENEAAALALLEKSLLRVRDWAKAH
ncbi:phosphomannomutase [Neorhizobium sp. JUb45]|uniref:phosphomannomutase n=1 Tax=unclassified Neorhizobium TaxID=2629175 RepID=UPI00104CD11B|nr:phosphomannomutase [Neorhizobium sp. JUb45]TCQ98194.1 phosphomannomutase [Neorhizobium sp. JUb45]